MVHVYFVAPFLMETTLRFVSAASRVDGARLTLLTEEPAERIPTELRRRLHRIEQLSSGLDLAEIATILRHRRHGDGTPMRLLGVLEQLQVPLAQVREELGIPGLGVEAARNFRDKSRMKTVLQRADLPCARHLLANSEIEALAFADAVGFPLVVKPPAGAGAKSTFRVNRGQELRDALRLTGISTRSPVLLEEFIVGEEFSFDCVFVGGRPVWHSLTRYLPTPLEVLQNPWIQWAVLLPREVDHPRFDDIRRTGSAALKALGMHNGLSHMEWFRRPDGSVAISEVGARPPGAHLTTLTSYAHDFDLYRAWAHLMIHDTFDPPQREYAAGAAYLRGQGQGKVRGVRGVREIEKELGHLIVESKLPRPDQPTSGTYEGEGYVILRHPETSVVARALARVISTIRVDVS